MVEGMMAARGIIVSHQTIRSWVEKFGRAFATKSAAVQPAGSIYPSTVQERKPRFFYREFI